MTAVVNSKIQNPKSPGFTLFEVMLAMALVSLVLIAVSIAIDVHLRVLDSGRTKVEEGQLARALLGLIADDLRSAVVYRPVDAEEFLPTLPDAAAGTAADAAEALEGAMGDFSAAADAAGLDIEGLDDLEESVADWTANPSDPSDLPPVPGLYGNRYQLQVDTSRLPRIDQYDGMISSSGEASATDLVSDVKTITYYVIEDLQSGTAYTSSASQDGGGLVRREWDRAAAAYAAENAQLSENEDQQDVIAPEVAAIEFLYFDGTSTEPVEEWDSTDRGGLPVAVEIAVAIRPARCRNARAASLRTPIAAGALEAEKLLVYRLLVHLPAAEPTTLEETAETFEESESWEDSDSSGDSGSSPSSSPFSGASGDSTGEGGTRR